MRVPIYKRLMEARDNPNADLHKLTTDILALFSVSVSLPLVEVDKDILKICVDAYNNGEKLTAIKVLKEEAKNKLYSFGLKDAEQFLKGYER
tara:strand:- start:1293 stop:1568 length:276 start_codon:yes stop_codon:yes gene_type:complete